MKNYLARDIRTQSQRQGVTAAALFHLAWALVLARASGRDDVVFGTVLFGRMQGGKGADSAMGMFINMLPLRVRLGMRSVRQCLQEVHSGLMQLLHHEHASLTLAQRCSGVPADIPLFSAILNYRHVVVDNETSKWTGIESIGSVERTNYPFGISIDDDGTHFNLIAHIHESVPAQIVCDSLQQSLRSIVDALNVKPAPEKPVCELDLVRFDEDELQVRWGVNSHSFVTANRPVHLLIEEQAKKRPDATAIAFMDEELSYADLNVRANRLAHRLISLGVGPETRVGVALERSTELVVSILAILKAGGAYLPLDPEYPVDRLAYMIDDGGVSLLLTHSTLARRVPERECVPSLILDKQDLSAESIADPSVQLSGENLMYVIYTSGSTGKPKGVSVPHLAVSNCMMWMQQAYELTEGETVLHKAPFSFDVSVWEIFWPLTVGARLVVSAPGEHRDVARLVELVRDQKVTAINFVPTMLKAFLMHEGSETCTELKHIMCGGEAVGADLQRDLAGKLRNTKLHDLYGPTETTIHVTHWTCDDNCQDVVPIGAPISDTKAYVLDGNLNLVAQGIPGELYIGGVALARGYLNKPSLTSERFVADLFDVVGGRIYRTGDLVKWNARGELEYLGRIDHQIKIRGFRIELGEIEAKLLSQPEVREAVVIADEGPAGARLVGYVSLHESVGVATLRERLGEGLPAYMVPGAIMVLDALPLNANGKIDRKALPTPEFGLEGEYEAPEGELEEAVAHIWAEVLEVERVGRGDDFFQLGGHSLLALKLLERMRAQGHAVQVRTLFEQPKLGAFVKAIGQGQRGSVQVPPNLIPAGCTKLEPEMITLARLTAEQLRQIEEVVPGGAANIQDIYPLAPLQEGMLFHHLL